MDDCDISNKLSIKKIGSGESIELDQRRIQLREGQNGIMALSYKAPLFETMELEDFFDDLYTSDRLEIDIGGTGAFGARFRGIIDGREKNFSQNLDHKILLLEEYKCYTKTDLKYVKRVSRFIPKNQAGK